MSFSTFLQALGAAAHLDIQTAEQAGGCSIRFGGDLEVSFEHDLEREVVQIFGAVLSSQGLMPEARSRLGEMLLQLHLFGLATGGCYFGYDPDLSRVLLFRTVSLTDPDQVSVSAVESFVNQLERWQKGLINYVSKGEYDEKLPVMQRV